MTSPAAFGTTRTRAARAGAGTRRAPAEPRPYDFRRPNRLSRDHVRALQIAYDTFARQAATVLTTTLRTVTTASFTGVEQTTYDDYVRSLPDPTFMALVSLDPIPGTGVLDLPLNTAMLCVDHLLGGHGAGDQPQRPLTDIEAALMRQLAGRVVHELGYAFDTLTRVTPTVEGLEHNPQFAQVAALSDAMLVASFDLLIGERGSKARLCLPFAPLFPVLEAATKRGERGGRDGVAAAATAHALAASLEAAPVEVSFRFPPVLLTPAQILDLAVGDVVPLRHPVSAPLELASADVTCGFAVPGAQGKHLACLVVEPPAKEPSP